MRLSFRKSVFARYTLSARRVIFFAAHGARLRGAAEVTTSDMLIGLTTDRHQSNCPFRFVHDRREELANLTGLPLPLFEEPYPKLTTRNTHLSDGSKRVLAYAKLEADESRQFWIDTDHLQAGLLREGGNPADALQGIGYSLEATRFAGAEARVKWPPKRPKVFQRLAVYPVWSWVLTGVVVGWVGINLFNLFTSHQ